MHDDLLEPIDAWIEQQPKPVTRQQAIYHIVRDWARRRGKV